MPRKEPREPAGEWWKYLGLSLRTGQCVLEQPLSSGPGNETTRYQGPPLRKAWITTEDTDVGW